MDSMKLNADNLKTILWKNLKGINEKEIELKQANAITGAARQILNTVNLEITVSRLTGEMLPNLKAFITE